MKALPAPIPPNKPLKNPVIPLPSAFVGSGGCGGRLKIAAAIEVGSGILSCYPVDCGCHEATNDPAENSGPTHYSPHSLPVSQIKRSEPTWGIPIDPESEQPPSRI